MPTLEARLLGYLHDEELSETEIFNVVSKYFLNNFYRAVTRQVAHNGQISPEGYIEIFSHLVAGKRIPAIKVYREYYGCSLLEAKTTIERWDDLFKKCLDIDLKDANLVITHKDNLKKIESLGDILKEAVK